MDYNESILRASKGLGSGYHHIIHWDLGKRLRIHILRVSKVVDSLYAPIGVKSKRNLID